MGGRRARRLCPHAGRRAAALLDAYTEASRALFDLFEETAPLVEGLSLEEAFLDVRGLERISGTPRQIGERSGAGRGSGSGWRSRSASRGRRCWPRWRAAPPSRTACSSSIRIARPTFLRSPAGGGALGRRRRRRLTSFALTASPRSATSAAATRSELEMLPRGTRGAPPPCDRPQQGPAPGTPRPASSLDRHSVGVRRRRPVVVRAGCAARHPRRPGHAPCARREPGGPHGDPPLPLRRLLPRHALADPRPPDRRHRARSWPRQGRCSPPPGPCSSAAGSRSSGSPSPTSATEAQLELPLDPRVDPALDRRDR